MINIPLFFGIVCAGIILTILIWYTGKKDKKEPYHGIDPGDFKIITFSFSIIIILYIVRVLLMLFTGVISQIYEMTIIGGLFAAIPLLLFGIMSFRKRHRTKV
jgi:hypothetical protein